MSEKFYVYYLLALSILPDCNWSTTPPSPSSRSVNTFYLVRTFDHPSSNKQYHKTWISINVQDKNFFGKIRILWTILRHLGVLLVIFLCWERFWFFIRKFTRSPSLRLWVNNNTAEYSPVPVLRPAWSGGRRRDTVCLSWFTALPFICVYWEK